MTTRTRPLLPCKIWISTTTALFRSRRSGSDRRLWPRERRKRHNHRRRRRRQRRWWRRQKIVTRSLHWRRWHDHLVVQAHCPHLRTNKLIIIWILQRSLEMDDRLGGSGDGQKGVWGIGNGQLGRRRIRLRLPEPHVLREVELGLVAPEAESGFVVGSGGGLGGVEGAEPYSGGFERVSYLGCPFPPWSLSYPSVFSGPRLLLLLLLVLLVCGYIVVFVRGSERKSLCRKCCTTASCCCPICVIWWAFCSCSNGKKRNLISLMSYAILCQFILVSWISAYKI